MIVIQLYQYIANYTAYRHLYGHLIITLVLHLAQIIARNSQR